MNFLNRRYILICVVCCLIFPLSYFASVKGESFAALRSDVIALIEPKAVAQTTPVVASSSVLGVEIYPSIFTTDESSVSINLVSEEQIQLGKKNASNILLEKIGKMGNSYKYTLGIQDLAFGTNTFTVNFSTFDGDQFARELRVIRLPYIKDSDGQKVWQDGGDLIALVDKEYSLPAEFAPNDLDFIASYGIPTAGGGMQLRKVAMKDLIRMCEDAKKEGYTLVILSAYRSYMTQESTYYNWVRVLGQKEADRTSARPGHSEHQLGTTIDFSSTDFYYKLSSDFGQTKSGRWLASNAYKYGFVLSYPLGSESITGYKYEPWHFRYVGRDNALKIYDSGLIPLEYLRNLYSTLT